MTPRGKPRDLVAAEVEPAPVDLESALASARARGARALVAIVSDSLSPSVLQGFASLPPGHVLVYEAREAHEPDGVHARLVPASIPLASTPEGFLAAVPASARSAAELLFEKLGRLDREMARSIVPLAVEWSCEGTALCSLVSGADGLEGALASSPGRSPIRTPRDAEAFLDEVIREHIARLAGRRDLGALVARMEPLLTPEEIAAFRD